jgi:hypothetical protein
LGDVPGVTCTIVRRWLVALLVLAVACQPAPRELTPKEVLDRAADAVEGLNTAHFALDQQSGSMQLATGLQIGNAEGDVQRPDRLQMKFTLRLGGISAESALIAIGEDLYISNPLSGQWQKAPSNAAAPRVLDKERGISNLLRRVEDPRKIGNEQLDGRQTQHLQGRVLSTTFAQLTGAQPQGDAVTGDVWIGADDYLPRQVRLEGALAAGDTASTVRVLKFSKFNEPVSIERPG